jgi:hypothetical protein
MPWKLAPLRGDDLALSADPGGEPRDAGVLGVEGAQRPGGAGAVETPDAGAFGDPRDRAD